MSQAIEIRNLHGKGSGPGKCAFQFALYLIFKDPFFGAAEDPRSPICLGFSWLA